MGKMNGDYVWVVESGDYEQRSVYFVAESVEAAVSHLKDDIFVAPYIVAWDEQPAKIAEDLYSLCGRFTEVLNYSTEHEACFDMTRFPMTRNEAPAKMSKDK